MREERRKRFGTPLILSRQFFVALGERLRQKLEWQTTQNSHSNKIYLFGSIFLAALIVESVVKHFTELLEGLVSVTVVS